MKKLLILILFFLPFAGYSQYWEVGGFAGISNYNGDLSPYPFVPKESHLALGGILRYNVSRILTVKGNIYYGTISGDDENATTLANRQRNLSFRSSILDIGIQGELNIFGYRVGSSMDNNSPYLFAGLSVFRFNPQALYAGNWVPLQPKGTEGQGTTQYNDREMYSLTQVAIPMGIGYKYSLSNHWTLGAELGIRYTFTDYLDDVSKTYVEPELLESERGKISAQLSNRSGELLEKPIEYEPTDLRGDPTNNDLYGFLGVFLTYTFNPIKCYKF